jgi:hypothetical protein
MISDDCPGRSGDLPSIVDPSSTLVEDVTALIQAGIRVSLKLLSSQSGTGPIQKRRCAKSPPARQSSV